MKKNKFMEQMMKKYKKSKKKPTSWLGIAITVAVVLIAAMVLGKQGGSDDDDLEF